MTRTLVLLFLLLSAVLLPAYAQECTRDSFFPEAGNCGYDVSDYRLDMTWDVNGDQWDVMEDITFTAEWDIDELHFDFTNSYEIYGLTIDGAAVDFELKDRDLTVRYDFAHDTEYHLYAGFRGKLDYGFIFDPDGSNREENSGFCMLNEPANSYRYYICNDHPKDKASYHYSFTVPAAFTPAGVGRLLEIKEADGTVIVPEGDFSRTAGPKGTEGTVTFTYEAAEPMAPYLFAVCAFPFDLRQKTLDSGIVELDFVDNSLGDDYEIAWEIAGQQEEILRLFESYLGPYPYRDLGAIVSPTMLGAALETQTRPVYDRSTLVDFIFAHELIHQWLGDLISIEDWSDVWIKEGAASYGEELWELASEGREAYEFGMSYRYDRIVNGDVYISDVESMREYFFSMGEITGGPYDRQTALDSAAALCRRDESGKQRIDPDDIDLPDGETVTMEQWVDAMSAACTFVRFDRYSFTEFYEMVGEDPSKNTYKDSYAGPKEITNDVRDMYGRSPYYGGELVYYNLHYKLGDEVFKQALQLLLERYAWSTVNEEKFIEVFSEAAGEDLTGFIRSWLYYGEGHVPDLPGIETYEEARVNQMS